MLEFIVIVLSLGLLAAIIYGLHKYQSMEVEYTVDRTMPLPPVSGGLKTGGLKNSRLDDAMLFRKTHKSLEGDSGQIATPKPDTEQASTAQTASKEEQSKASWQDQVAAAKQSGDFDQALQLCRQQYPLWGAFNQACITLRSKLKLKLTAQEQEAVLSELYRTAVIAELLHDKSEGATRYTLNQLRKLDQSALESLEVPYSAIGYAQLRLIRKSDVKLLLSAWNRPASHQLPRTALSAGWQQLAVSL